MQHDFFDQPILNSPYEFPSKHWEFDANRQPTNRILKSRRLVEFFTPIPKPKKRKSKNKQVQTELDLDLHEEISSDEQKYRVNDTINDLRKEVDRWRESENYSKVTAETARLLQYWRHHDFQGIRPFFCQLEAVETLIWLTEVAPSSGIKGQRFLDEINRANQEANPELSRVCLKLATGAGKTTVMAMIIAWQTINAIRKPKRFTRGFLIITPGITIKDRLRVLQPNDPESYYRNRELIPPDMLQDLDKAKIVITNYHTFKLRETLDVSKGTRSLLQGRGEELQTLETEGKMLQRVMSELMGLKNILVLNDEAHHCYREKPGESEEDKLKGDDNKEGKKNTEAARLWINGIETVKRNLGVRNVIDLSATPFFLKGSGYVEGTLFPWTMSDFSLMDAIECGIVKLPRVPISDNIPGHEMPIYRNLWEHVGKELPKSGRSKAESLDPEKLPVELQTALQALYGHYKKTFEQWKESNVSVPPCFIVVCNNTSTSKLVHDYISGYVRTKPDGSEETKIGKFELFQNFDENGFRLPRPRTLLIDSEQLESGDALDKGFRDFAKLEIEQFRSEIRLRTGDHKQADNVDDSTLLREVMNTVGKSGKLGESIRCVVSVSMLTEGWDTNTVTHVLGVRAFGTQLLCEQVIGRALRRQSYDLNENGLFNVEYADVLGIPFDFNAKPTIVKPVKPKESIHVHSVKDRELLEIHFPRVNGYRVELPNEKVDAEFNEDSTFQLTPAMVGPTRTRNQGIIGEGITLDLDHLENVRKNTVIYELTTHLLLNHFRDPDKEPEFHLFGDLKRIVTYWLDHHLKCMGNTKPALIMYKEFADEACNRIRAAVTRKYLDEEPVKAVIDPYNPIGTTRLVNFYTSKIDRWETDSRKCHVNWVILDSDWEAEFCRVAEDHSKVYSYVKNHGLGFEVPYRMESTIRKYRPDFILKIDDGHGVGDLLHLVVEIKGYRGEDAKVKKDTMDVYWIPGINNSGKFGRWSFIEFTDVWEMEGGFAEKVRSKFDEISESASHNINVIVRK